MGDQYVTRGRGSHSSRGGSRATSSSSRRVPGPPMAGMTFGHDDSVGSIGHHGLFQDSPVLQPPVEQAPPPLYHHAGLRDEFYARVRGILERPGHERLPHLHPHHLPNTLWFDHGSVASAVREIFEKDWNDSHPVVSKIPESTIDRWFFTFAHTYHWDDGYTDLVRREFFEKIKARLPDMVGRWKKKWEDKGIEGLKKWFSADAVRDLVTHWQNPDHQIRSENSSAARKSDCGGLGMRKHRSGQISFSHRGRMIAESSGASEPDIMAVLEQTKRGPDGVFIDGTSEKLYNDVNAQLQQLNPDDYPESTASGGLSPAVKNKIFLQTAPKRKGKISGIGSLQSQVNMDSCSIRSSQSYQSQQNEELIEARREAAEARREAREAQNAASQAQRQVTGLMAIFGTMSQTDPRLRDLMQLHFPPPSGQSDDVGPSSADPNDPSDEY